MFIPNGLSLPEYSFREEMIDPLGRLLEYYVENHSKVLVVRFDLHFPITFPHVHTNQYISETIAYIVKKYKRDCLDPMYYWAMERKQGMHPHYHVVLFLDGQKVHSYKHVFHNAEDTWSRHLNTDVSGCVHHCNRTDGRIDMNRNGLMIRRCDGPEKMQEQKQNVYNQISYLAKSDTKCDENDGLRNFGMSRIPKNNKN